MRASGRPTKATTATGSPAVRGVALEGPIRPPYEGDDRYWIARVQIKPLQSEPVDVRGVDSFHSIWLACQLILKLLTQLKAEGARLENADGSEFPLDAYLAGF